MVIGRVSAFTCFFIFISNSCETAVRGTVNGIGQTLVAVGRMLGPTIGSLVFAWSMNNGLTWPLDFHLTWYLLAIIGSLAFYMVYRLPLTIESAQQQSKEGSTRPS